MVVQSRQINKYGRLILLCGVFASFSLLGLAQPVMAQLTPQLVHFFNQTPHSGTTPQENLRLVNSTSTSMCAMIYVFDRNEELQEACGCPLSEDKEARITLDNGLTASPFLFGANMNQGEITIFSTKANNGKGPFANGNCDPGLPYAAQAGVVAWMEYVTTAATESSDSFTSVPLDLNLSSTLITALASLAAEVGSSGPGICTCGDDNNSPA